MIATYTFVHLLDKMSNSDKDIRFMATNDLLAEIQKDSFKLDDDNERKLVAAILKIVRDNSGEVQNLGVKCIAKFLTRCRDPGAEKIVDTLCHDLTVCTEERIRDISSLGLKAASQTLGSNSPIARRVATKLVNSLSNINQVSVLLDTLDIVGDIILKQGHNLASLHFMAVEKIFPLLEHERQAVRKRTIQAIQKLSLSASSQIQSDLLTKVISSVEEKAQQPELQKTILQTLATLVTSRSSALIVPIVGTISELCKSDDDELRESAITTIESILRKSPQSIHNVDKLLTILNGSIQYDPNYYGDDDEEDDEEIEDSDEDEDWSDDEDVSWKVRRSCAKCFDAIIISPYGSDPQNLSKLSDTLLSRFKEREESVLLEILSTFKTLLKKSSSNMNAIVKEQIFTNQSVRLLKSKKSKVVVNVITNLSVAVEGCPEFLTASFNRILPLMADLMKNNSETSIRLDVINFFRSISKRIEDESLIRDCSDVILPALESSIHDTYYLIVAEALRVVQLLINKGAKPFQPTCQAAFAKLRVTDMDQEVKDAAILCVGVLLSKGAFDANDQREALKVLIHRISNEMTRLSAVKSIQTTMLNPQIKAIISGLIAPEVSVIASFLRKNQRPLRVSSLNLLGTLIQNGLTDCDDVLIELPQLINEQDLHVAQLAMQVAVLALEAKILTNIKVSEKILSLVQSPLLQGAALKTLLKYLNTLVKIYPEKYKDTARALTQKRIYKGEAEDRNEIHNIAKCLAELTFSWANTDQSRIEPVLEQMLQDSEHSDLEKVKQFSLLTLGELGRRISLGPKVVQQQISQFKTQSEDIKVSAAIGLGLTAAGNIIEVLPILLNNLNHDDSQGNYLTLIAIRQATVDADVKQLNDIAEDLYDELQKFSGAQEEGTRNVLAECLGRTVIARPTLCQKLQDRCLNEDHRVRQTQLSTAKYACHLPELDILPFLNLLSDSNHVVRRAAIAFVNSCAHNNPSKLRRHIKGAPLSALYNETKVRPELIREVMMGPFKHKIDDGLEIRKATFECLSSLLDTCHSELDFEEYLESIETGFKDDYDVKICAYLILLRIAQTAPNAIGSRIERFFDTFKSVLTHRVKPESVKQEYEKADELKRSVLRVFNVIHNHSLFNQNELDLDQNGQRAISDLLRTIDSAPDLTQMMETIRSESSHSKTKHEFVVNGPSSMEWQ